MMQAEEERLAAEQAEVSRLANIEISENQACDILNNP